MVRDPLQVVPERDPAAAGAALTGALLGDDLVGLDERIVIEDPLLDQEPERELHVGP